MNTRTQLSLFVPPSISADIEKVRRLLDPVQAALIPAHVTLCREDELEEVDLESPMSIIGAGSLTLKFGAPEVFAGHGVLLPCIEGEDRFGQLRRRVLGDRTIRQQAPHLTLAHPRNPRAPQNLPENLAAVPRGLVITFTHVQLIRQEGTAPWQIIAAHAL